MRKGAKSGHDRSTPANGGASRNLGSGDLDSIVGRSATLEEEQFLRDFEQKIAQSIVANRESELMPRPEQRAFPPESVRPPKPKSNGNGNGEARIPNGSPAEYTAKRDEPRPVAVAEPPEAPRPVLVAAPARPRTESQTAGLPAVGAILELSTGQIVVFDRDVDEQQIQMVLELRADGTVKAEAVNLRFGCQYREIGALPAKDVLAMHVGQVWHRAQLLFHLHEFADSHLVPVTPVREPEVKREPTRNADWPDVEAPQLPRVKWSEPGNGPGGLPLHRGQRVRISMGHNRSWDAVYWGNSGAEAVVAHQTHGDWAITNVNLSRFAPEAVTVEGEMTEREVWELEEILKRTYL